MLMLRLNPKNSAMKKLLAILTLSTLIFLAISCLNIFREADSDVGKKTADFEISAKELVENFEMNEDSANSRYLGKIVLIKGNISNISEQDDVVSVYLKADEDLAGVLCSFDPKSINLQSLKVGNELQIKGICSGYLLDVVLNKCTIVEK
jgi:hypothetical protein